MQPPQLACQRFSYLTQWYVDLNLFQWSKYSTSYRLNGRRQILHFLDLAKSIDRLLLKKGSILFPHQGGSLKFIILLPHKSCSKMPGLFRNSSSRLPFKNNYCVIFSYYSFFPPHTREFYYGTRKGLRFLSSTLQRQRSRRYIPPHLSRNA